MFEFFKQKASYDFEDVITKCIDKGRKDPFPKDSRLIIETTGSLAVREALAELPPERLPGRLLHAGLYEQGEVGFMAIEGADRNPKINDLVAYLWDERIDNEKLHAKFSKDNSAMSRQNVGLGCGSHTMGSPPASRPNWSSPPPQRRPGSSPQCRQHSRSHCRQDRYCRSRYCRHH